MLSTFLPGLAGLTNKSTLADLDKLVIGDSQTNMWNNKQIGFAQLRALMGGNITSVNGMTGTVVLSLDDLTGIPTPDTPNTVLVWTGSGFEWNVAPTGDLGIPLATWRQDSTGDATITGAVNGVNVTFELTNTPVSATSVILSYNGLVLERGVTDDYTISGKIITTNFAPVSGKITATYVTQSGTFLGSTLTASEMLGTDGTGGIISLPVATYPSLSELAFLKGITSDVQAQINAKQATLVSGTNIKTVNGASLLGAGDLVVSGGGITYRRGVVTRDLTDPTGTVAVTHNLGTTPKLIKIYYNIDGTDAIVYMGTYDVVNNTYWGYTKLASSMSSDSSKLALYTTSGGNLQSAIISATSSTTFTFSWTKTGSPTGTITIVWEAFA